MHRKLLTPLPPPDHMHSTESVLEFLLKLFFIFIFGKKMYMLPEKNKTTRTTIRENN
jgi:hypothetical protein